MHRGGMRAGRQSDSAVLRCGPERGASVMVGRRRRGHVRTSRRVARGTTRATAALSSQPEATIHEPGTHSSRIAARPTDSQRPGRFDHRPHEPAARGREPDHPHPADDRQRDDAEPAMVVRRQPDAAGGGRLGAADDGPRAADRDRDRRRQHAPEGGRRARASLPQGGRVGLHDQGRGSRHGGGPRAAHVRRRRP